jgi:hypothetical protein
MPDAAFWILHLRTRLRSQLGTDFDVGEPAVHRG